MYQEYEKGYKVVRQKQSGILVSAMAGLASMRGLFGVDESAETEYKFGSETKRHQYGGPFGVFSSIEDAETWLTHNEWSSKVRGEDMRIASCLYTRSYSKAMYFKDSKQNYWMPKGTVLADSVILIHSNSIPGKKYLKGYKVVRKLDDGTLVSAVAGTVSMEKAGLSRKSEKQYSAGKEVVSDNNAGPLGVFGNFFFACSWSASNSHLSCEDINLATYRCLYSKSSKTTMYYENDITDALFLPGGTVLADSVILIDELIP